MEIQELLKRVRKRQFQLVSQHHLLVIHHLGNSSQPPRDQKDLRSFNSVFQCTAQLHKEQNKPWYVHQPDSTCKIQLHQTRAHQLTSGNGCFSLLLLCKHQVLSFNLYISLILSSKHLFSFNHGKLMQSGAKQ